CLQLTYEGRICECEFEFALQLIEGGYERFRDVAAAVGAETSRVCNGCHGILILAVPTASATARSCAGSLIPGSSSTPEDTSTTSGRMAAIASPTFKVVSPPASTSRDPAGRIAVSDGPMVFQGSCVPVPPSPDGERASSSRALDTEKSSDRSGTVSPGETRTTAHTSSPVR